jgi:hypothetical protein
MDVFCTSKNSNPSWAGPDPWHVVYIGTSLEEELEAVGTFVRYEKPFEPFNRSYIPYALPHGIEKKVVRFYTADGWWFSIVKFQLIKKED